MSAICARVVVVGVETIHAAIVIVGELVKQDMKIHGFAGVFIIAGGYAFGAAKADGVVAVGLGGGQKLCALGGEGEQVFFCQPAAASCDHLRKPRTGHQRLTKSIKVAKYPR